MSSLLAVVTTACAAPAETPVQVNVAVHASASDPVQATFTGPASGADDFQLALRDELSGRQSFADATAFLLLTGPDGQLEVTPIDPEIVPVLQVTIDGVAAAFDFEGPALAVDAQLKEDGYGNTVPAYVAKPVNCCKKICPDSYPQAGTCDYICSDTGCAGGSGGGSVGGGGGDPGVCKALCYAPTIGPCFDSIFTDWNPACTMCKSSFCW